MNISSDGTGLVFNIVFTKNTFYYFRYLTRTFLQNSSVQVRIVLNGCSEPEQAEAINFVAEYEGRVFLAIASNDKILPHHDSINMMLAEDEKSEYFCFADSDIFARDSFMHFFSGIKGSPGMICSGDTIWTEDNVVVGKNIELWGRFYYDQQGWTFGSSYFCIYNRMILNEIMEKYSVDFRRYAKEAIPKQALERVLDAGHDYSWYDTGKVLNILMVLEGYPIKHVPNCNLVHVGGMSWYLSLHRENYERMLAEERKSSGKLGFLKRSKIDPRLGISTDVLRLDFAEYAAQVLICGVNAGSRGLPEIPKRLARGEYGDKLRLLRSEMRRMLERQNL